MRSKCRCHCAVKRIRHSDSILRIILATVGMLEAMRRTSFKGVSALGPVATDSGRASRQHYRCLLLALIGVSHSRKDMRL